jgi:hypothetical protein
VAPLRDTAPTSTDCDRCTLSAFMVWSEEKEAKCCWRIDRFSSIGVKMLCCFRCGSFLIAESVLSIGG